MRFGIEALEGRLQLSTALTFSGTQTITPGSVINVNAGGNPDSSNYQSEMSVGVNPTNPLNIAGFSHHITTNLSSNSMDVIWTEDGGLNWDITTIDDNDDGLGTAYRFGLEDCVAACVSQYADEQIIGVLALAAPRDARVRPYLRGKLTTPHEEVNLAAARALGMIGEDLGYGVALKGAKASDPRQRALAALAFGAIGRADAQGTLDQLLRDPDENVRLAAAVGVLQLKPG